MTVSMLNSHLRLWEIVESRNLKDLTADSAVEYGEVAWEGKQWEDCECGEFQIVVTAPQNQLFNLPSVCRLITVLFRVR